jgi:galactose-1-phosphate uridylyltransferase
MAFYEKYYHKMPDGTIKQINPFSNTEVWCVEERGRKPTINTIPHIPEPLELRDPEDYCHFCETNYVFTPPEKNRDFIDKNGVWKRQRFIAPEKLGREYAEFRRVGNLFEIVTYDYWRMNYNYTMPDTCRKWQEDYLGSKAGYEHIMNVLGLKMRMIGADFDAMDEEERLQRAEPFFGGCHELLIGRKHFIPGARHTHELCSSGSLTPDEHYRYIRLSVDTLVDIYQQNPYVRYISVFQNWLKPAGASFDHLHKQLVGLDEWGVQMTGEIDSLKTNPNLYNELAANFAIYNSLLIAENDHAMAFTEIGHRFPTVAVYSKSEHSRPFEHTEEEIRGMSDLVHAIHSALTGQTTCNEEWFFAPFDTIYPAPWHILIKLRLHNPAGFEGNTKIYINPISPDKLCRDLIEALAQRKIDGLIAGNIRIGNEVRRSPNPLKYYKGMLKNISYEGRA